MSNITAVTKSEQAEERTSETRSFMQSVSRATRRRFTPEEKIRIGIPQSSVTFAGTRIVLEGFRRETTVNDLCRREGINPANCYPSTSSGQRPWTKEFSAPPAP